MVKMLFHFVRVEASDIPVEAPTVGECAQKAYDERMKEVMPKKFTQEIIE